MRRNYGKTVIKKTNTYYSKIAGITLILFGIILLFIQSVINPKISSSLIFIGFIVILMINENKTTQGIDDKQLILIIVFLTWLVLMFSLNADFDLYIILIAIGIFVVKEFLNDFLGAYLQKRLNFLFYISVILFVLIVVKRIISLSGMYPS